MAEEKELNAEIETSQTLLTDAVSKLGSCVKTKDLKGVSVANLMLQTAQENMKKAQKRILEVRKAKDSLQIKKMKL